MRLLLRERAKATAADPSLESDAAFRNQTRFITKLTEHTFGETHGRFNQHTGWSNTDFMRNMRLDSTLGQTYRNYSASWNEQHDFVEAARAALAVPSASAAAAQLHQAIENEFAAAQPRRLPPPGYEPVAIGQKVRLGECEVTLRASPAAIVGVACAGREIVGEPADRSAGDESDDLIAYHYHTLADEDMATFRAEYAPSNDRAYLPRRMIFV